MRALHSARLTAGIIRVAPHDNLTDIVQDAVCFIKVPTSLLTTHVRLVVLHEFQQIHCHFLQVCKVCVRDSTQATANIPLRALDAPQRPRHWGRRRAVGRQASSQA